MKITGELIKMNEPTANGRIYSQEAMQKAIDSFNNSDWDIYGELYNSINVDSEEIDPQKISHKVEDLNIEDGKLTAEIELLDTPYGEMASTLMKTENFELFPRMIGKIMENNEVEVEKLITIDLIPESYFKI